MKKNTRTVVIVVFIWIMCAFHNWGTVLGYYGGTYSTPRDHYGWTFFYAITGPIAVIPAICLSNVYEHGFLLK